MDADTDASTPLDPVPIWQPGEAVITQFLRFAAVGTFGFCVDTATVYGTRAWLGLYGAGLLAWFVAATANWALNRAWTFPDAARGAKHRQWALFLATNSVGFFLNRGTYVGLIAEVPLCRAYPVLATAAGAVAGMFANFHFSRRVVFR